MKLEFGLANVRKTGTYASSILWRVENYTRYHSDATVVSIETRTKSKRHLTDTVLVGNLNDEGGLIDNEASVQFFDALACEVKSLFEVHLWLPMSVHCSTNEVLGVPMSSIINGNHCTEIVNKEHRGTFALVISSEQHVNLIRILSQCGSQFGLDEVGDALCARFQTATKFLQSDVSFDVF